MGRTKTKVIDDSSQAEEVKVTKKAKQGKDEMVERLREELGIEEAPKVAPQAKEEAKTERAAEQEEEKKEAKPKEEAKPKQHPKVGKQKPRSKKYQEAAKLVDPEQTYVIDEAVDLAKKVSYSKFDGALEIHLNTNIKNLRGAVSLPFASGKSKKILAFGKGAEESGADMVGDDKKIEEISKGKIDFDVLVTTPEWMGKIAPLAKVLGPKGLMPNPKNDTITDDLKEAVSEAQSGKLEYKTESNQKVMHLSLGKISQPNEELSQNVKVLLSNIGKSKIRKAVLSPTMGPGVKLDLASL